MTSVIDVRERLNAFLRGYGVEYLLDEQDLEIVALRLGLTDGTYYTLRAVGKIVGKSPEMVRCRQHHALKSLVKHPLFFKLLRDYSQLVKLPVGVTYYLKRYSDEIWPGLSN